MKLFQVLREFYEFWQLPSQARKIVREDKKGLPEQDISLESAIHNSMAWLYQAQDQSVSHDGGVARHFSLVHGWAASYPETTGYIIPTMLDYAHAYNKGEARERAQRMLDWLVSIQFPEGGFQGGMINAEPVVPVTFNTGQILIGLARGVREFGEQYREAMRQAADWLVATQDADGCWRKFPTPFAEQGEKAYETHVAWGLFEAARVDDHNRYAEAAVANIWWALGAQQENGWFAKCCLTDPLHPLTHTLGYVLRGILEAYRYTQDNELLQRALTTADGLLTAIRRQDGYLPGRLSADWTAAVPWVCLTGSVQIAYCWLALYRYTNNTAYRDAAFAANSFVRRTLKTSGPDSLRGGIKGSFPVCGGYGTYEYLNWAAKFFIDAQMLEQTVRAQDTQDITQ